MWKYLTESDQEKTNGRNKPSGQIRYDRPGRPIHNLDAGKLPRIAIKFQDRLPNMKVDEKRVQVIFHRLGMRGDTLIQRLQVIKEQTFNDKQQLTAANPGWNPQKDARLLSLGKFINVCERTQFGLHILGSMLDDDWYQSNMENETQQDPEYKMILTVEFEKSLKYGFGMSLFTVIESSFRIFLRSIDPTACKGATTAFDSIHKCLLGSKHLNFPAVDRQAADELLEIVRLVRNLIHNDGVYFDEYGSDKTVIYRGVQYQFYHSKPVDFVYWDLLLTLVDDLRRLLIQVISHPRIVMQIQVTDPFMAYYT